MTIASDAASQGDEPFQSQKKRTGSAESQDPPALVTKGGQATGTVDPKPWNPDWTTREKHNFNFDSGTSGNDTLNGAAGDDYFRGKQGADTMTGRDGDDVYLVDNPGDKPVEDLNGGIDTVKSSITYTLPDNIERLILTGTKSINGTGNYLDNFIKGNDGKNVLDGKGGADTMAGGYGDDTYIVDNSQDKVIENEEYGFDTVKSLVDFTLPANVERLILQGTAQKGVGNELDNQLIGNAQDNILIGGWGNDSISGGAGADRMYGGYGDDLYVVDNIHDQTIEDENGRWGGVDTVEASVSFALSANIENLTLTGSDNINGTGNELDNVLNGNIGNNWLNGGDGNDVLDGGKGNDTLTGGGGKDTFLWATSEGKDVITDFMPQDDVIRLKLDGAVKTWTDLMSHAKQDGSNVVIAFGDDTLVLQNVLLNQLNKQNLLFS